MSTPRIQVLPDLPAIARAAADLIVELADQAITLSGTFTVALSGGNTPSALYEALAGEPHASAIQWPRVRIFFSDERCVGPDHADSNFRLAAQTLLDRVPIPYERIHRMPGELDPAVAADQYDATLRKHLPDGRLDLALLGLGEDGHTASLFPETAGLEPTLRWCVANHVPRLSAWRLTLTAGFINRSRHIVVLAAGAGKQQAIEAVLEGPPDPRRLPMQLIDPADGQYTWLIDAAAAGMSDLPEQ